MGDLTQPHTPRTPRESRRPNQALTLNPPHTHPKPKHALTPPYQSYPTTKIKLQNRATNLNSQIMHYEVEDIPEAKFNYDISPMSVVISSKRRAWSVR